MNEGTKTGIFWCVAVVMLAIAAFVAWPASTKQIDSEELAGTLLFPKLTDPSVATSMKIVTFDEEQGQLDTFEVRKDRETGVWTIPSRGGYPADAVDQMKDAANAFVGLKILDVQTSNAEDHDDLGVAEPKLEDLQVGDEGVGRLVTLKDESQQTIASLIIGDETKDDKIYVRKPGQDPVYVVKLDEAPLTTKFQTWIEDDLLKLSSIDIEDMEIKDYNAAINVGGQINMTRNYDARVMMEGSEWKLDSLAEYVGDNPLAPPTPVEVGEDQKLNTTKINDIKNALDDLKIADVKRKPDGMSATLRANQDLLTDKEAIGSLAQRGFYPIQKGSDYDILSANGELTVGLKNGVRYILRFGNISGLTEDEEDADSETATSGGVNRYLLVTTQVDQSKFPAPDLREKPETVEELKKMLAAEKAAAEPKLEPPATDDAEPKGDDPAPANAEKAATPDAETSENASEPSEEPADEGGEEKAAEESSQEGKDADAEPDAKDAAENEGESESSNGQAEGEGEPESVESETGETESAGSGQASGSGQGQEAQESTATEEASGDQAETPAKDTNDDPESTDETKADSEAKADTAPTDGDASGDEKPAADDELTDEEWQERLEAEQEKVIKENQRKLDERNEKLDVAKRKVRELNERFADWYYVIPEDTYTKLRIKRDELFEKEGEATAAGPNNAGPSLNLPGINIPGVPGK